MSQDGADLGFTPYGGMGAAMGGSQEERPVINMVEYLETAPEKPDWDGDTGYDDSGRIAGKIFLDIMRRFPETRDMPADDEGAFDKDENGELLFDSYHVVREGVYSATKRLDPELGKKLSELDLSGFLVGWAVNAARTALELRPVANPAIVTIG